MNTLHVQEEWNEREPAEGAREEELRADGAQE